MSSPESPFLGSNAHHWEEQNLGGIREIESMTSELRAKLEEYRRVAKELAEVTDKVGQFIPEEVMNSGNRGVGTEYRELYELWVESPGDEALGLQGAQ